MHDAVLPATSLFHANGWGVPFTAALAGAKVVLAGPFTDGEGLLDLMEQEHVNNGNNRRLYDLVFPVLDAL